MKYTYCEKLIWYVMHKTIIEFFNEKHPKWNLKLLTLQANNQRITRYWKSF